MEFRVRYAETDQMGRAYYGAYFAWFEVGRAELLRDLGLTYRELEAQGYLLTVTEAHARYLAPASYDEMLVVRTRIARTGPSRVEFSSEVISKESERRIAEGSVTLACVDSKGTPRRLPAFLRERGRPQGHGTPCPYQLALEALLGLASEEKRSLSGARVEKIETRLRELRPPVQRRADAAAG